MLSQDREMYNLHCICVICMINLNNIILYPIKSIIFLLTLFSYFVVMRYEQMLIMDAVLMSRSFGLLIVFHIIITKIISMDRLAVLFYLLWNIWLLFCKLKSSGIRLYSFNNSQRKWQWYLILYLSKTCQQG